MKINALVLGKSGAGKSSLLNYLWGAPVRPTGAGRPVTPEAEGDEVGIYAVPPLQVGAHEIIVYDSHGLEADKAERWSTVVREEMDRREASDDPERWFHAVIYCVDAKKSRLDDFEIMYVINPLLQAGHPVTVAFTKSDLASEDELSALETVIRSRVCNDVDIIRMSSESKLLRNGTQVERSGGDDLVQSLVRGFLKGVTGKFEVRFRERFTSHCNTWKNKTLQVFDDEAGIFRKTSSTMAVVNLESSKFLSEELALMAEWTGRIRARLQAISNAFNEVVSVEIAGRPPHGRDRLEAATSSYGRMISEIATLHWAPLGLLRSAFEAATGSSQRRSLEAKLDASIHQMTTSLNKVLIIHPEAQPPRLVGGDAITSS